jgi:3-dehydroquinate synthetase/shikimate kinase
MGAGKSTLGPRLAKRLGREFVSVDAVVEERTGTGVVHLFAERGEAEFRELEERAASEVLASRPLVVVELGGGALAAEPTREALATHAFALLLETTPDEAWSRVAASSRPLAQDRESFTSLFEARRALYDDTADGRARDLQGALLAVAGIHVAPGASRDLSDLLPGSGAVELVVDAGVDPLHGDAVRASIGARLAASHTLPAGESAKTLDELDRLWSAIRLDRTGMLVALGGGSTCDVTGVAAATYMRGIPWVAVPTTLVGQVDAAIGGKTAIDLHDGKNLVGAFHWPARVAIDPELLATLPEEEMRNGLAEVVKTGLLAGDELWELPTDEQVRRCAAFKAAVCLRDPYDRGERAQLNLGHTFAHALEAASDYSLPHGRAVALGLLAALRLSGLDSLADTVDGVLRPRRAAVDRERAWAALARDKKAVDGKVRLVLLEEPGRPLVGVGLDPDAVRSALDALIE